MRDFRSRGHCELSDGDSEAGERLLQLQQPGRGDQRHDTLLGRREGERGSEGEMLDLDVYLSLSVCVYLHDALCWNQCDD